MLVKVVSIGLLSVAFLLGKGLLLVEANTDNCDAVAFPVFVAIPMPPGGFPGFPGLGNFIMPSDTNEPTKTPTNEPTIKPTNEPTKQPTNAPTKQPTNAPTNEPTNPPTNDPTIAQCSETSELQNFEDGLGKWSCGSDCLIDDKTVKMGGKDNSNQLARNFTKAEIGGMGQLSTVKFSFDYTTADSTEHADRIRVYYQVDGAYWQHKEYLGNGKNKHEKFEFTVPAHVESFTIRFETDFSGDDEFVYVDNIKTEWCSTPSPLGYETPFIDVYLCDTKPVDVCLAIDMSGSVCNNGADSPTSDTFGCNNFHTQKQFAKGIIEKLTSINDDARFSLVTFSDNAKKRLDLVSVAATFSSEIDSIVWTSGWTNTGGAIMKCTETLTNAANARVIVLITDGTPTTGHPNVTRSSEPEGVLKHKEWATEKAELAKNAGILVVPVIIATVETDKPFMKSLASGNNTVVSVTEFDLLPAVINSIVSIIGCATPKQE